MTSPSAADYGWIRSASSVFNYALEIGYTMTLVRGVSPAELLRTAGADPCDTCVGIDEFIREHGEIMFGYASWTESFLAGAFEVPGEGGSWALALDTDATRTRTRPGHGRDPTTYADADVGT
ncbi:DUF6461 domain-containing protein (plasmid) [Streptomyces sp. NBC_01426]|uniref:DUF6461 domain-containing protein n=2 Tax=unclassified Streptomyces TaxID=2593676 RepID=UPI002E365449|nr:DUF6461 domain-containing protein [Streptomyces sp. NBC_01426]